MDLIRAFKQEAVELQTDFDLMAMCNLLSFQVACLHIPFLFRIIEASLDFLTSHSSHLC